MHAAIIFGLGVINNKLCNCSQIDDLCFSTRNEFTTS